MNFFGIQKNLIYVLLKSSILLFLFTGLNKISYNKIGYKQAEKDDLREMNDPDTFNKFGIIA